MEEIPLFAISLALGNLWRGECLQLLEEPRTVVRKLYPELYLVSSHTEAERIGAIVVRGVGYLEGAP
jgi:hypothetical protein